MTKRRNTFTKEVEQNSSGGGRLYYRNSFMPDSKLLKRMDSFFQQESERWRRIKGQKK